MQQSQYSTSFHLKSQTIISSATSHIHYQLLRHRLHKMLQLHRIAAEATYHYEFTETSKTIPEPVQNQCAPVYGVRYRYTELEEFQGLNQSSIYDNGRKEWDEDLLEEDGTMLKKE